MHKLNAHNAAPLEEWVDTVLREASSVQLQVQSRGKDAQGVSGESEAEILLHRAGLFRMCYTPLIQQSASYSERLSLLLSKVVSAQERFIRSIIARYDSQVCAKLQQGAEMRQFVGFSQKQLSRREEKVRWANDRRKELEDLLFSKEISLKLLEDKLEEGKAREEALETENQDVLQRIRDAPPKVDGLSQSFSKRMDATERQIGVQLKLVTDLEDLLADMNRVTAAEHEDALRRKPVYETCSVQTEEGATPPATECIRFRKTDPPLIQPKKWKIGWEIPYDLRCNMNHLKLHKRGLSLEELELLACDLFAVLFDNKKKKSAQAKPPLSVAGQVVRFFEQRYKDDLLRDWHLIELINSLRHHRDTSLLAEILGGFLGVFHEESTNGATDVLHHSCCYEDPSTRSCTTCLSSSCFNFTAQFLAALGDFNPKKLKPTTSFHAARLPSQAAKMMDPWELVDNEALFSDLDDAAELMEWKGKAVYRISFAKLLAIVTAEFSKSERIVNQAWKDYFDDHAVVRRFIFGTVIPCARDAEPRDVTDLSYFSFVDKPGFSRMVKEAGMKSAKPKDIGTCFAKGIRLQQGFHEAVSSIAWAEASIIAHGFEGRRTYFVNQVNGDRVWDERPAGFLSSPAIDTVQNLAEEIDLPTVLRLCHENGWYATGSSKQ